MKSGIEVQPVVRAICRDRALVLVALFLSCSFLAGCDRGHKMYRVKGHVFYKDGSVPTGGAALVGFVPGKNSTNEIRKGACGPINPDGSFEMYTRKPYDGVFPGEYNVNFAIRRVAIDPTTSVIAEKYAN